MKNLLKLSVIILGLALYLMPVSQVNAAACTPSSTRSDHNSSGTTSHPITENFCSLDAETIIVKLYEFGLCTGPSSPSDVSACSPLFVSSGGLDVDLTVGSSKSLIDEVSLVEGTYTNAYLKISDVISIKAIAEFEDNRISNPKAGLGTGTGKFCFTDGRSINDTPTIVTCAENADGAEITTEKMWIQRPGGPYGEILDYELTIAGVTTETDLYTFDANGAFVDNRDLAVGLYGDQTLPAPIKIDANTSNIDLGILVTDGVSLGFRCEEDASGVGVISSSTNYDECVSDVSFNGLRFVIAAE